MKYIFKSIIFWLIAIILGAGIALYQRYTGPTYELRGETYIANDTIKYELYRTQEITDSAKIEIPTDNPDITGSFRYKRYTSPEEWTEMSLRKTDSMLFGKMPILDTAGKIMYVVTLYSGEEVVELTEEPVILRYKGEVPDNIVFLHVIMIFLAFIFSVRAGLEALIKGKYTFLYTWLTLLLLVVGGLIFGPIMQKYAFGAYWTGWPFGGDLTDNKTAVAFIFWLVAFVVQFRNRDKKAWALWASIILFIVFLVPHSLLGSEKDYSNEPVQENVIETTISDTDTLNTEE